MYENLFKFVVGIGGPVGSGKTHLMLALCLSLREKYNICAVREQFYVDDFMTQIRRLLTTFSHEKIANFWYVHDNPDTYIC